MVIQKENKAVFNVLAKYMDGAINLKKLTETKLLSDYDNSWVQELTPAQKKVERREKE